MAVTKSLRSRQRTNMLAAYRGRAHRNNNLWLVYSVKTDRDWILPSDRQLVHWIHYLETDHRVKWFDLTPNAIRSHDGKKIRYTELDAVVTLTEGRQQWHEVKTAVGGEQASSQLAAQALGAKTAGVDYKIFTDTELKPHVDTSMRWLKAIAYAAALRNKEHIAETVALLNVLRSREKGLIAQILGDMTSFDDAVILGLIARLAIQGHINLDMTRTSYGAASSWHCVLQRNNNVES